MIQRPRRNRVTPFGAIERSPHRGTFMGNRGDLHGPDGEIVEAWSRLAWITCQLDPGDGHQVVFDTPGSYAPLFFTDEAVALAAGHRPCGSCRPDTLAQFKECWRRAHGLAPDRRLLVTEIDDALHRSRIDRAGRQRRHRARLGDLPDGSMVTLPQIVSDGPWSAFLLWQGRCHLWQPEGYGTPTPAPASAIVNVLTPAPTVAVLAAGYRPEVAL